MYITHNAICRRMLIEKYIIQQRVELSSWKYVLMLVYITIYSIHMLCCQVSLLLVCFVNAVFAPKLFHYACVSLIFQSSIYERLFFLPFTWFFVWVYYMLDFPWFHVCVCEYIHSHCGKNEKKTFFSVFS